MATREKLSREYEKWANKTSPLNDQEIDDLLENMNENLSFLKENIQHFSAKDKEKFAQIADLAASMRHQESIVK